MKKNYVSPKSEYIDFAAEERILTSTQTIGDITTYGEQDGSSPETDTDIVSGATNPFVKP